MGKRSRTGAIDTEALSTGRGLTETSEVLNREHEVKIEGPGLSKDPGASSSVLRILVLQS